MSVIPAAQKTNVRRIAVMLPSPGQKFYKTISKQNGPDVMANDWNPSYTGDIGRRIMVPDQPWAST
jgi:hypothetical protein